MFTQWLGSRVESSSSLEHGKVGNCDRVYTVQKRRVQHGSQITNESRMTSLLCVVMNSRVRPLTSRSASSTRLSVYTRKKCRVELGSRIETCDSGGAKSRVELGSRITLILFTWLKIAVSNTIGVSNPRAESLCKHGISIHVHTSLVRTRRALMLC